MCGMGRHIRTEYQDTVPRKRRNPNSSFVNCGSHVPRATIMVACVHTVESSCCVSGLFVWADGPKKNEK